MGRHYQVEFPLMQPLIQIAADICVYDQLNTGELTDKFQQAVVQIIGNIICGNAKANHFAILAVFQLIQGLGVELHHLIGVVEQGIAGFGQHHASIVSEQQRLTDTFFQLFDL